MAKQIANPARHQIPPAAAAPIVRATFGVKLHDVDGGIEYGKDRFEKTDLFWGLEAVGAHVYSFGDDHAFVESSGRVTGRRHINNIGWHDTTKTVESAFITAAIAPPRRRVRDFASDLFSSHERVEWIDVTDSGYKFLNLDRTGAVAASGKPMSVGDSPNVLANGWIVSRPGDDQVNLTDHEGIRDRWRFQCQIWQRLVKRQRVPWTALGIGIMGTPDGELVFTDNRAPSLIIPSNKSFTMHLSEGRTLVRLHDNGPIFALSTCDNEVAEYVCEGRKLWQQEGARDFLAYQQIGVPGFDGEKPVLFKEVMPNCFVYADGKIEALNRAFLGGEVINLACGGVRIHRAEGIYEPIYISANGVFVGYVYSACGDWFKMTPVSPDQKTFSWRRCLGQQSPIDVWLAYADRVIGKTAGLRSAGLIVAGIWRFVKAAADEPCMAPFSPLLLVLYMASQFARAALLLAAAPVNLVWRLVRRVRRAFQLMR